MSTIPASLKLLCSGDAATAQLVDAATGLPWTPPGDVVLDVHYLTPEQPWETPPVYERDAQGQTVSVRTAGVPAVPVTRASVTVHLADGGRLLPTPATIEVPPGTAPFRLHNVRLVKGAKG